MQHVDVAPGRARELRERPQVLLPGAVLCCTVAGWSSWFNQSPCLLSSTIFGRFRTRVRSPAVLTVSYVRNCQACRVSSECIPTRLAPPAANFARAACVCKCSGCPSLANYPTARDKKRKTLSRPSLPVFNRFCGCRAVRTPARRRREAAVQLRWAPTRRGTRTPCFGTPSRCWRSRRSC